MYASVDQLRQYLDQVPNLAQQTVTLIGAPTGGTIPLVYGGVATTGIPFNASAAQVAAILAAHPAIGSLNAIAVTGAVGGPWSITFQGAARDTAGPLSAGTNALTGGSSPAAEITITTDALLAQILERASDIVQTQLPGAVFVQCHWHALVSAPIVHRW